MRSTSGPLAACRRLPNPAEESTGRAVRKTGSTSVVVASRVARTSTVPHRCRLSHAGYSPGQPKTLRPAYPCSALRPVGSCTRGRVLWIQVLVVVIDRCGVSLVRTWGDTIVSPAESTNCDLRISVTLEETEYVVLTRLAASLDLSAVWLIRRAVSECIARYGNGANAGLPLDRSPRRAVAKRNVEGDR